MIRTLVQLRSLGRVPSVLLSGPVRIRSDVLLQVESCCAALRFSTITPNFISQKAAETDVMEYMARHEISVSDKSAPAPCLSFEQSGLPDYLLNKLLQDFTNPTPIQAQALPIALSGKNSK